MKFLYVLVSDENDYYLEQALLSITTLKYRMPVGFISLLIDDITEKTLINKRRNILEFVDELKIVVIDGKFNKKERSRWLKTSMRQHIEGDFLFIDSDTVIADDLTSISNQDIIMGAVLDSHVSLSEFPNLKSYCQANDKKMGFNASFITNKHFNSGVIFCKDTKDCHVFFEEWHKLWFLGRSKNVFIDQPAFNQANVVLQNIISELDGIWNCQIVKGGIQYLVKAKIIHFYTAYIKREHPYILANNYILKKIKEKGYIDSDITEKFVNIKSLFQSNSFLVADPKILNVIGSSIFLVLTKIYHHKLIQFIDLLLSKIIRSIK
jgi:hypothetical protein